MTNPTESTLTVTRHEIAMLMELVSKAAAAGPQARTLADLFDKVMVAGNELGVSLPPSQG